MQLAASQAANGLPYFQAAASAWCTCVPAGPAVSCGSTWPAGSPQAYVQVQTSAAMPVLMTYPGLPANITLHGFSALRVR